MKDFLTDGLIQLVPAYIPFLLPIGKPAANTADWLNAPLCRPLDEERILIEGGFREDDWPTLSSAIEATTGLPLLCYLPDIEAVRVHIPESDPLRYARTLLVDIAGKTLFLMEHPEALPQFDALAEAGWSAMLTRPSLFARLHSLAESEGTVGEAGILVTNTARDSQAAFHSWLRNIVRERRPSDLHLDATAEGFRWRSRSHGILSEPIFLARERGEWIINSSLSDAGLQGRPMSAGLDGRLILPMEDAGELPIRLSLAPGLQGPTLALRFIYPTYNQAVSIQDLGMPSEMEARLTCALDHPEGLWVVAGPTGSGKSTTLHVLLTAAVSRGEKVMAVEDPVERPVRGVQHVEVNARAGMTFAVALRAFMRQAPDTILVGEIRDPETARIALQAALTGHRVLSTLHARDTEGMLSRMEDFGIAAAELERGCRFALHQRLVPILCPKCCCHRGASDILPALRTQLAHLGLSPPAKIAVAVGCPACRSGYAGRTAIFSLESLPLQGSPPTASNLLTAGWNLFAEQKTDLTCIQTLLPASLRRQFTLCQL